MISAELLDEKIKILEAQRDEHLALYQQAVGAIAMAKHLRQIKEGAPEGTEQ